MHAQANQDRDGQREPVQSVSSGGRMPGGLWAWAWSEACQNHMDFRGNPCYPVGMEQYGMVRFDEGDCGNGTGKEIRADIHAGPGEAFGRSWYIHIGIIPSRTF